MGEKNKTLSAKKFYEHLIDLGGGFACVDCGSFAEFLYCDRCGAPLCAMHYELNLGRCSLCEMTGDLGRVFEREESKHENS